MGLHCACGLFTIFLRAGVAQLVERFIRNEKVGGSIPFSGTISTFFSIGLPHVCFAASASYGVIKAAIIYLLVDCLFHFFADS